MNRPRTPIRLFGVTLDRVGPADAILLATTIALIIVAGMAA